MKIIIEKEKLLFRYLYKFYNLDLFSSILIMVELEVIFTGKDVFHARTAALFVQNTNRFDCDIFLNMGDKIVDAKSIMGLLALGIKSGEKLLFKFNGRDENEAKDKVEELFNNDILLEKN